MSKLNHPYRAAAVACALLFTATFSARASSIYDATGGAENGGDPLSATTGAGPILADRFMAHCPLWR